MHVAAGTMNAGKLKGAERAVRAYWPEARFEGRAVPHGTEAQPMGREQTVEGAIARARLARRMAGAEVGLGIEGGAVETGHGMLVELWAAAVGEDDRAHVGAGPAVLLPEAVADQVRAGRELGPVVDAWWGLSGQKQAGGVIALLTGGEVTRIEVCRAAVLCALAPIRHAAVYASR
ncbi:MAG: DUF84 family protein [Acidobacteria bacterium]|nr:DUF84 family protein [Acidobacteriota bacterium]